MTVLAEPIKFPTNESPDMVGSWFKELDQIVVYHPVIGHEFLRQFSLGEFVREQLQLWAKQQFFFSISLPSAFAALYARVPDGFWKEKRHLVELLKVEAWGSTETGCHSRHFIELCDYLGIDVVSLQDTDCTQYTRDYLNLRLELCLSPSRHLGEGLASIAWGNELLNMHIFGAYQTGMKLGVSTHNCPPGYFDAHLRDEEHDAAVFQDLFRLTVTTDAEFNAARSALTMLLDARVRFFDALLADLNSRHHEK
jgi:hypothetical protein